MAIYYKNLSDIHKLIKWFIMKYVNPTRFDITFHLDFEKILKLRKHLIRCKKS